MCFVEGSRALPILSFWKEQHADADQFEALVEWY
jgi:hypothetical protein